MKQIPLTQGCFTTVDDDDFEILSAFKWCVEIGGSTLYAVRGTYINGKKQLQFMHRVILGITDSRIHVDHIDHNGLNNTRSNIRPCTHLTNSQNMLSKKNSSSAFVGVSWCNRTRRWVAQIRYDGKNHGLGHYNSEYDAALVRDLAAKEHFGEFAYLNFPP